MPYRVPSLLAALTDRTSRRRRRRYLWLRSREGWNHSEDLQDMRLIYARLTTAIAAFEELRYLDTSWIAGLRLRTAYAERLTRNMREIRDELAQRHYELMTMEYDRRVAAGERLGKVEHFCNRRENRIGQLLDL